VEGPYGALRLVTVASLCVHRSHPVVQYFRQFGHTMIDLMKGCVIGTHGGS
jgi:hypothetical protein